MIFRIKLDENLPTELVEILASFGHDVDSVPSEGLGGRRDEAVWNAAQSDARFLITQDLDSSDIRRFEPGTHEGILLLRLREPNRRALTRRVRELFESEPVKDWERCFVVATERKVRVRRPSAS